MSKIQQAVPPVTNGAGENAFTVHPELAVSHVDIILIVGLICACGILCFLLLRMGYRYCAWYLEQRRINWARRHHYEERHSQRSDEDDYSDESPVQRRHRRPRRRRSSSPPKRRHRRR